MINTISALTSVSDDNADLNKDIAPQFPDDLTDLGEIQTEIDAQESLGADIANRLTFLENLQHYAPDAATVGFAVGSGFLSSVSQEALMGALPSKKTFEVAVEGMVSDVKARIKLWLSKMMETGRRLAASVKAKASRAVDALKSAVDSAATAAGTLATRAGETIKAHPYETVAAVLVAVAAGAALIAMMTGTVNISGASESIAGTYNRIATSLKNIKFPGKRFSLSVDGVTAKFKSVSTELGKAVKTRAQLGWTGRAFSALKRTVLGMRTLPTQVATEVANYVKTEVGNTTKDYRQAQTFGKKVIGAFKGLAYATQKIRFVVSMMGLIAAVFRFVVIGGMNMVRGSVRSAVSAHATGKEVPA